MSELAQIFQSRQAKHLLKCGYWMVKASDLTQEHVGMEIYGGEYLSDFWIYQIANIKKVEGKIEVTYFKDDRKASRTSKTEGHTTTEVTEYLLQRGTYVLDPEDEVLIGARRQNLQQERVTVVTTAETENLPPPLKGRVTTITTTEDLPYAEGQASQLKT